METNKPEVKQKIRTNSLQENMLGHGNNWECTSKSLLGGEGGDCNGEVVYEDERGDCLQVIAAQEELTNWQGRLAEQIVRSWQIIDLSDKSS